MVTTGGSSDKPHIREHVYSKDTRRLLEKRFKDESDLLRLTDVCGGRATHRQALKGKT